MMEGTHLRHVYIDMKLKNILLLLLLHAILIPLSSAEIDDEAVDVAETDATENAVVDDEKPAADPSKPLPKTAKPPRKLEGGWTLEWNDEFNGTHLDKKKWKCEYGIVRNKGASQAYVEDCVKVKDGVLKLISKAEQTKNPNYGKPGVAAWDASTRLQPFASGSVTTKGIMGFTPPGRLEFRARIPKAKGVWPAIWTMHDNQYHWPANGEIDILEHISAEPNSVHSIFRWGKKGDKVKDDEFKIGHVTRIPDLSKEFHIYVLEWDKDTMRILIDDKEVGSIQMSQAEYANGDNPLLTPCYIIMNTAIGGVGTWAPKADPADYPVEFHIDYVRYYKRKGANAKTARADSESALSSDTDKKSKKRAKSGDDSDAPASGTKKKRGRR